MRLWPRIKALAHARHGSVLLGTGGLSLGITFHAFHGPEHLLCMIVAAVLALSGLSLSFLTRKKEGCCPTHNHEKSEQYSD